MNKITKIEWTRRQGERGVFVLHFSDGTQETTLDLSSYSESLLFSGVTPGTKPESLDVGEWLLRPEAYGFKETSRKTMQSALGGARILYKEFTPYEYYRDTSGEAGTVLHSLRHNTRKKALRELQRLSEEITEEHVGLGVFCLFWDGPLLEKLEDVLQYLEKEYPSLIE